MLYETKYALYDIKVTPPLNILFNSLAEDILQYKNTEQT